MSRRKPPPPLPPPLPAIDRRQSMAVRHVAKFVADELVLEPRAFLRLGALGRVYWDWCEMHGVVNRRISSSELLLRLERDYGLSAGTVYTAKADGGQGMLYALRGARLRLPELNARQGRTARVAVTSRWMPIIGGVVPDAAQGFADADDDSIDMNEDDL